MRVKNIETGETFRLVIAPLVWGLIIPETGEAFSTMPTRSSADHGVEIVQASKRERELLERHDIMPEQPTLIVEDEHGNPTQAWLDFAPCLAWPPLGCLNPFDAEDNPGRVVAASPNDRAMLRRFGFGAMLDGPGEQDEEPEQPKRAA